MRAPTASWWWNVVPLPGWKPRVRGLPMSWNSAARRVRRKSNGGCGGLFVGRSDVVDHGDGVTEDVLVTMDRIVLEAQRRKLREELLRQSGVDEEPQPGRRVVDRDQLVELVADALRRDDLEAARHALDGGDELGVGLELVTGDEARGAQHPQWIVGEADLGPERRAEHSCREVGRPAERIDELGHLPAGELERHRVHREVTPREIGLDRVGEHDVRLARVVGVRLGPERRDLVDPPCRHRCRAGRRSSRTSRPGSRSSPPNRRGSA